MSKPLFTKEKESLIKKEKKKMKKFILGLIACLMISTYADAQVTTMTGTNDTVVNAGSKTLTLKQVGYYTVSVQAVVTKISGTVGGYAILQGSIDGTNYVNISTDSLKMTNVTTNSKIWVVQPSGYLWYRVLVVGTGTMAAKVAGTLMYRKP